MGQVIEDLGATFVTRLRQLEMNFNWFVKEPQVTMRQNMISLKNLITELQQPQHPMIVEQQVQVVIRSFPKSWETMKTLDSCWLYLDIHEYLKALWNGGRRTQCLNVEKSISKVNVVETKSARCNELKSGKGKGNCQAPKDVRSTAPTKQRKKVLNKANAECYKCHKFGHYARECTELEVFIPKHNHLVNVIGSVMMVESS